MDIIDAPLRTEEGDDKIHALTRGIAHAVTLKDGELFMLVNEKGEIPLKPGHGLGLYLHDMRYLAGYSLRINGIAMECLGVVFDGGREAVYQMANFPLDTADGLPLDKLAMGLDWKRTLDGAALQVQEQLTFRNFVSAEIRLPLTLRFDAQFRDIFQVRGLYPQDEDAHCEAKWKGDTLVLSYDGLDGVHRQTRISFSIPPARKSGHGLEFDLQLAPLGRMEMTVTIKVREGGDESEHAPRSPLTDRAGRYAKVSSSSLYVSKLLDRSLTDLRLLINRRDEHDYYAAGLPWFGVVFGRDSLLTAMMTLPYERGMAQSTLRLLSTLQGRQHNEATEEEPGRIPHELRCGELARSGRLRKSPDYGTIDATPIFLMLFRELARWTGSTDLFVELRDNVERALEWIDARMERSAGWLGYQSTSGHSCKHQGWKDVEGAVARKDGSVPQEPIALVEVQGLVYSAWLGCADLFRRIGEEDRAVALEAKARDLKTRFDQAFWVEDGQYLAMALEKGDAPLEIVTSNMGQALWTGIVDPGQAIHVARHLLDENNFCGWGIRTMSSRMKTYCPFGYHNGGVWPHDNALIASGLKKYGFDAQAEIVVDSIIEAAFHFPLERLPELYCGYPKSTHSVPISYPTACHPQAWASAAVPCMLATAVGLEPDGFARQLVIRQPRLPWAVPDLVIKGIKVADASVDLTFRRRDGFTDVTVDKVCGNCRVVIWPRHLL
jgi:glycogen debranching enzyme